MERTRYKVGWFSNPHGGYYQSWLESTALKLCTIANVRLLSVSHEEHVKKEVVPKFWGKGTKEVERSLGHSYSIHVEATAEEAELLRKLTDAWLLGRRRD